MTASAHNLLPYHQGVLQALTFIGEGRRLAEERAKRPAVPGNWPTIVKLNGERFGVLYGVDEAGELVALLLLSLAGEKLFLAEMAVTQLTSEDVWAIIAADYPAPAVAQLSEEAQELYRRIAEQASK